MVWFGLKTHTQSHPESQETVAGGLSFKTVAAARDIFLVGGNGDYSVSKAAFGILQNTVQVVHLYSGYSRKHTLPLLLQNGPVLMEAEDVVRCSS